MDLYIIKAGLYALTAYLINLKDMITTMTTLRNPNKYHLIPINIFFIEINNLYGTKKCIIFFKSPIK